MCQSGAGGRAAEKRPESQGWNAETAAGGGGCSHGEALGQIAPLPVVLTVNTAVAANAPAPEHERGRATFGRIAGTGTNPAPGPCP